MRWPQFGRRGTKAATGRDTHGGSAPGTATHPEAPAWTTVAPIPSSWGARNPLTAMPATPAAPLLARVRPAHESSDPAGGVPAPGRVAGLARVVPTRAAEPPPVPAPPPYFRDQPPLRHVNARLLREHPPLTEATDAYVGEPVVPAPVVVAPPAPPPGFPAPQRVGADPAVEATTEAGARFREALANLHSSGLPRYISPSETASQPQTPPVAPPPQSSAPQFPPTVQPTTRGEPPRLTHRRNTLAQSRKLGLGSPLRQDGTGDEGESPSDTASDAEPARADLLPPPVVRPAERPHRPATTVFESPPVVESAPAEPPAEPASPPVRPPLVYRARRRTQSDTLAPATSRPPERAAVTRPPAELAQALRASHGIDVSDVPVQRDTAAGGEARQRRARAFTRGARVFLPEDAGPVTSSTARGLLAHELVHAAQQRRLGTALPETHTAEGRALEAEAVAAEQMYSAAAPFEQPELIHAPPPVTAGWVESRITQHAATDPPMNYLDIQVNESLTAQQREAFQSAARESVQKVIQDQRPELLPSPRGNPFTSTSAEDNAERQFLEIINTELARRDEAPQLALSEQDKVAVRRMFERGTGAGGGAGEIPDHESSRLSRWQEEHLGGAMALGADFGGIMNLFRVGQIDHHVGDPSPGGAPASGGPRGPGGGQPTGSGGGQISGGGGTGATGPLSRTGGGTGTTGANGTTGTRPAPRPGGSGGPTPVPDHESSRLSRWQEGHLGGAMALGADFGGIMNLFHAGQIDHRVGDPSPTQHGGAGGGQAQRSDGSTFDASTQSVRGATGAGQQPGQQQGRAPITEIEMDDIAVRIYDRLRSRLRRELLVDRERAGLLTDFR